LEAGDRRRAGCWDSIHQSVNLQRWECDDLTLLLSCHRELAGGGRSWRDARRKLKLHSAVNSFGENEGKTDNFGRMLYSVYAVHGPA